MTRNGDKSVKWFTALRRRPIAGYAVVVIALALVGVAYAALAPGSEPAEAAAAKDASQHDIAKGKEIFDETCATCHGLNGEGTKTGPSLIGVGAAAVDFQVSTGRMPAQNPGAQMPQKPPVIQGEQVRQLSAYVASLGGGPAIPSAEQSDPKTGDVTLGNQLFMANCAQCHNFAGSGGALTKGKFAPSLKDASPTQIYEAMLTGPQAMPVFNDSTLNPDQKRAIIAYVTQTRSEVNPGGDGLGRIGPVSEGLVGWLAGIGLLVLAAMWITARQREQ